MVEMDPGVYAGQGAGYILEKIKKKIHPTLPRLTPSGCCSLLLNQPGAVAIPPHLAHINTVPWMNAQCTREVRALEVREQHCRIARDRLYLYSTGSGDCYDNLPGIFIQMVSHITSGRLVLPAFLV
jgi:hypothetical protein